MLIKAVGEVCKRVGFFTSGETNYQMVSIINCKKSNPDLYYYINLFFSACQPMFLNMENIKKKWYSKSTI